MKATEYLLTMGKPIAYYPKLAKPLGGVSSAILFSQLFYWQDKATSELGVYKTRDELEDETGLSHNEQRTAIKKLSDRGVLIVTEKRLVHKTYYKIDNETVNKVLSDFAKSMIELSRDIKSMQPELNIVDAVKATKSSSLDQEITTEITTSNNRSSCDDKRNPKKNHIIDFDLIIDAYNDAVEDKLPKVVKMTTARKNAVKKLLKELDAPTFQNLANYFYDFAEKANRFYFGENDRGWRADFDYIVKTTTYLKFIEGSL